MATQQTLIKFDHDDSAWDEGFVLFKGMLKVESDLSEEELKLWLLFIARQCRLRMQKKCEELMKDSKNPATPSIVTAMYSRREKIVYLGSSVRARQRENNAKRLISKMQGKCSTVCGYC